MSVRYSRLATEDMMESGLTGSAFDYSSAFSFTNDPSRSYKSAFTYTTGAKQHIDDDLRFETASRTLMDRACFVILNTMVFIIFVLTFPVSVWFSIKMVPNFERAVVFRWGQLHQTKGPGMIFVMPFVDRCHKVDVRMKAFTVPPQQVITGDKAIIEVGADVYYRIASPELSITNVQNLDKSTRVLLQTSLLNQLVQLPFSRIEGQRNAIAQDVQDKCNKMSITWGIEICRLDISQVKVLQKPPTNQPKPSIVMPPGLANFGNFGAAAQSLSSGAVPEAFQQLASAFMAAQGLSINSEPQSSKQISGASVSHNVPAAQAPPVIGFASADGGSGSDVSSSLPSGAVSTVVQVQDILQSAQCVLNESLVRKVNAVYQFQLHGEGGGMYFLDLKNGSGSAGEGVWLGEDEVDASLMMTVEDLQLMLSGQLKPFQAYMSGRLRVSGDLATALKLEAFVDKVVAQSKQR